MILITAIVTTLIMMLELYKWDVIISALITWVNPDPSNPIVQILRRLTEPVYSFIRRYVPTVIGGIDLAPIIIIFGIFFLQQLLRGMAQSF
jgi:YggT family protein